MASKSIFISFIKSIVSFRGDLSTVTAPTFLLAPHSYLVIAARWPSQPSLFVAPAKETDPAKRALLVLKWFLSTIGPRLNYWGDEAGRRSWAKKPLNPFLGEIYTGHWEDEEAGRTEMVVEQVGHHPPCTAICVSNAKYGVKLQGYVNLRSHFSGPSIMIDNIGHLCLRLDTYDEEYIITLCPAVVKGLFTGHPYPDLAGDITIYSSSGFTARAHFSGKGWLSGKRHSVNATVHANGDENALYSIQGSWMSVLTVKDVPRDTILKSIRFSLTDQVPVITPPISEQDVWETHRAWKETTDAMIAGDSSAADVAKYRIENSQRRMRIKEREEGTVWKARFFKTVSPTGFLAELLRSGVMSLERGNNGEIWRFDESLRRATRPFHGGTSPWGTM